MLSPYYYRGVNADMYEALCGALKPKLEKSFSRSPIYGHDEYGNCYYGDNPANEVIEHQRNQAGIPTSGISFTPHFERARVYATRNNQCDGFIYVVDDAKCRELGISIYSVNDLVPYPSVPEDSEVILVAKDFGVLPKEIVVEILKINTKGIP